MLIDRRVLILSSAALALSGSTVWAEDKEKDMPCDKLFMFLRNYLELPAADRTHFKLAYRLSVTGAALSDVKLLLKHNGQTQSLAIAPDGLVTPPSLAALKAHAPIEFSMPKGTKLSLTFSIAGSLPNATNYAAADLKKSVDQARAGAKKAAGIAAMAVPNFDRIIFSHTGSGQVVLADGKTQALPMMPKNKSWPAAPYFAPVMWPTAVRVTLDKAPSQLSIGDKPKS
ncbi:hypothetical protein [Asticcacaulis sp. YBE204]|uniref:hypothetical protein n=1 Tax=Asticcacaulis sp. YBE204 TaxID=1282363 RepID=UPI0003C41003|nr:hypothetical protein [Asticcacaulis sp. YBE204]ESQ80576.1 hypothetical protein AEYBE204_04720 [Asticcacaulis sp. YBE204]